MIKINYKFIIENVSQSHVSTLWKLEYLMFHRVLTLQELEYRMSPMLTF